eukprot:TRINITY_DN28516_c0_g1_i1.p1 TRINITY_DN28516_c0_g1~~TRINITY_DN28516_c0_g1_i1.p1  ORF type:complete len:173 (+),score=47.10 TRINITY_DN28516_c0_g1_i1:115-633(+)
MAGEEVPRAHQPPATLEPDDIAQQAQDAQGLAELRTLKAGLDLRLRDSEEARRRIFETQRVLGERLNAYGAYRGGLREELEGMGMSGRRISQSLEAQSRTLQTQRESLENERFARDVLRDEARRLREELRDQPVRQGAMEVRSAAPGASLWVTPDRAGGAGGLSGLSAARAT